MKPATVPVWFRARLILKLLCYVKNISGEPVRRVYGQSFVRLVRHKMMMMMTSVASVVIRSYKHTHTHTHTAVLRFSDWPAEYTPREDLLAESGTRPTERTHLTNTSSPTTTTAAHHAALLTTLQQVLSCLYGGERALADCQYQKPIDARAPQRQNVGFTCTVDVYYN